MPLGGRCGRSLRGVEEKSIVWGAPEEDLEFGFRHIELEVPTWGSRVTGLGLRMETACWQPTVTEHKCE